MSKQSQDRRKFLQRAGTAAAAAPAVATLIGAGGKPAHARGHYGGGWDGGWQGGHDRGHGGGGRGGWGKSHGRGGRGKG